MAKKKKPEGRPTSYRKQFAQAAFRMALIGATDAEMAMAFCVCEKTLNTWKHQRPEFLQSIKDGKLKADSAVAASLYKRAMGFTAPDVHICVADGEPLITPIEKYYPPDTAAAIFFLKNRRPQQFRQNPEVAVTVNNETQVDLTKPPEEWGQAELEAELQRRGALPVPPRK